MKRHRLPFVRWIAIAGIVALASGCAVYDSGYYGNANYGYPSDYGSYPGVQSGAVYVPPPTVYYYQNEVYYPRPPVHYPPAYPARPRPPQQYGPGYTHRPPGYGQQRPFPPPSFGGQQGRNPGRTPPVTQAPPPRIDRPFQAAQPPQQQRPQSNNSQWLTPNPANQSDGVPIRTGPLQAR